MNTNALWNFINTQWDDINNLLNNMDINALIIAVTAVIILLVLLVTYRENKKRAKIEFYKVVAEMLTRHTAEEITTSQDSVMRRLTSVAELAKKKSKTLFEYDPTLHRQVSVLANYYESIGLFLKMNKDEFPARVQKTILEMLHNSVFITYQLIDEYKDVIYPNRIEGWAMNYQWLYQEVKKYRKKFYHNDL